MLVGMNTPSTRAGQSRLLKPAASANKLLITNYTLCELSVRV
jgi:hypothetical protein